MISLNPVSWFSESSNNHFHACLTNVEGLNISKNLFFENYFGYHPVKANGVEIGYFNIANIDQNVSTELELIIPKKFNIPQDSILQLVNDWNLGNLYRANYLNISLGDSTELLNDKAHFAGNGCPIHK